MSNMKVNTPLMNLSVNNVLCMLESINIQMIFKKLVFHFTIGIGCVCSDRKDEQNCMVIGADLH